MSQPAAVFRRPVTTNDRKHIIPRHIRLTSHPGAAGQAACRCAGERPNAALRGPVVASPADHDHRNAIGSYSGSYAVYRALAVATGALAPDHRPDFTDTAPAALIGPWPQWADPNKIVSLDPYGHLVGEVFAEQIRAGIDARPTIAITAAQISLPEIRQRIEAGDIVPDGRVVLESGEIRVTKAAIDPVWYLPGIAARFGVAEPELRRTPVRGDRRNVPGAGDPAGPRTVSAADRRQTIYLFGEVDGSASPIRSSPAASTMNATARTCSARTSAPAGLSRTRRRSLRRDRAAGRGRHRRLQSQGGARPRRGHQIPRLQCAQAAAGRRHAPIPISAAPNASPGCTTCGFRN